MLPPRLPPDHPDSHLECEEALESRLTALMDLAREAGWPQEKVASAVIEIAYNYILRLNANDDTNRQIAAAMAQFRTN